jgi:hypothetical protein
VSKSDGCVRRSPVRVVSDGADMELITREDLCALGAALRAWAVRLVGEMCFFFCFERTGWRVAGIAEEEPFDRLFALLLAFAAPTPWAVGIPFSGLTSTCSGCLKSCCDSRAALVVREVAAVNTNAATPVQADDEDEGEGEGEQEGGVDGERGVEGERDDDDDGDGNGDGDGDGDGEEDDDDERAHTLVVADAAEDSGVGAD